MPKVLIVEDDESLRDVYKEEFEAEGFEVEAARDGREGVEKLHSFETDILVLDIMMPTMSGFDVLKALKEEPLHKPIPIMVTTNIYTDTMDLIKNWNVSSVLLKVDYTPGEIVGKARELLANQKQGVD